MQTSNQNIIHHKGLSFRKLYDEQKCKMIIEEMALKINSFYQNLAAQSPDEQIEVVSICLLKGAFMFYTDLIRRLHLKMTCDFVKISSYKGEQSTGQITIEGGFDPQKYKGKNVIIIEDMADTGLTLQRFRTLVQASSPKTLKTAVLVNRPDKPKNFVIDWIGIDCSNFIVGYGLDYDQFGRKFPAIYQKI